MIANSQVKCAVACRIRGGVLSGLGFLAVCLMATWMTGCHEPGSTGKAPAVQQGPEAAGLATQKAGEEPGPTPSEVQVKAVKPAARPVSGRQPQITFENDVCDLGEIGVGTKLTGQFKFTNTGNVPLKITLVQGCCGVTTRGVEAGQEYAPGQSGALEFDYQALTIPNPAVKRMLYLQTNDPEHKITTLTIKAAIVRRVDYKPEVLKLVLRRPNGGCPDITLKSLDGKPFSITDFAATAGSITAEFDPAVKAAEFVLKPKADMAKLEQNMTGRVSIDLTHPDCRNVELRYDVLPEFTISPPSMMMFGLKAGQGVRRDIWILSNYEGDFEIESVSSLKGTIQLVEKTKVGNRYDLRVEVMPPPRDKAAEVRGITVNGHTDVTPPPRGNGATIMSDTLEVKVKDGKTLTIPFRGFYQDR